MDKERIEQAATEHAKKENLIIGGFIDAAYERGFTTGAEWRINSVWHDVTNELPECNRHVVNEDWFDFVAKDEKDLKRILKDYPFKYWAYVDDLLPVIKEDNEL